MIVLMKLTAVLNDKTRVLMRFIVLACLFMLAACGSDVQVTAQFNATQDVRKGDSVFLNQQIVGEVAEVNQREGKTIVSISLSDKGEELVKQKAAVVVNRLKPNKPVEIYNLKETNQPVINGDELQGLDSLFQLGAWMVGESLELGSDSLLGYVTAFQKYLNGEQWQQDKKVIREGVNQLGKEAENMAETLSQQLNKATDDLQQVEKQAAQAVEQLGDELAPVMGELARSGKAIAEELDKFSRNIEQQNTEGQELGTTVMKSLLEALQKMNQSMDRAIVEGQSDSESNNALPNQKQTLEKPSSTPSEQK